jgi:uncharacterized protein (TIGR02466 family)
LEAGDLLHLAVQQHQAGRLQEAEALYRRVLELDTDQADALHLLGVIAHQRGQNEAARALIERAIGNRSDNGHYHLNLGNVLRELGKLEEAASAYQRAIAIKPDLVIAHMNLGALLQEQGNLAAAVTAYERVIAGAPRYADAHYNLAVALKDLGRLDDAIAALWRSIEAAPSARRFVVLAGYLLERHNAREALAACDRCLQLDPRNILALAFKSVALGELGERTALRSLLDFDRLIAHVRISTPPGFADVAEFNRALIKHVRSHPSLIVQPRTGATRSGSHTEELLVEPKGPFTAFENLVNEAIGLYLRSLIHDPGHPYLAHSPVRWRLTVWGVILDRQGHQEPHMHADGWVSGVYYAKVPAEVNAADGTRAGWIEFGRPPAQFQGAGTPELRAIRPEEGLLLLFPSYCYHRTIPYDSDDERISIAFDALPQF